MNDFMFGAYQPLPGRHPARMYGKDSLRNFVTGLGTQKDPRTSSYWYLNVLDRNVLENAYRSDWLARRLVDLPAYDSTREWRSWQADQKQIQSIDRLEKKLFLRHKTMEAITRARLYGGAALVMGVDVGEPEDELDPDDVGKGDLQFIVVLNRYELSAGPRIYNVSSPYYTRPEYYMVSTPMFGFFGEKGDSYPTLGSQQDLVKPLIPPNGRTPLLPDPGRQVTPSYGMIRLHPSRVIEFSGNPLPDWRLAPMGGGWGDSVLQTIDDSLRDFAMIMGGLASMVNDMKMDVVSVPELSRHLSTNDMTQKFVERWSLANQMKSTVNTLMIDKEEKWERINTSFGSTPDLIRVAMQVACAAGGVPMSRIMGQAPNKGLGTEAGNETDLRYYYDDLQSLQHSDYRRIMYMLDRVIVASATGKNDEDVDHEWNPLFKENPAETAQVALQKAQTTQIYVNSGLINEDALRDGVVSQLTEDKTYPALETAIEEYGAEPEEPPAPPQQMLPTPPPGMLNKGQFDPNPFHMLRAQAQSKAGQPIRVPPNPPRRPGIPAPQQPQPAKDAGYDPNEPREHGKWTTEGGEGGGAAPAAGNYGLVPGDAEKFHALKDEWARVNNDLLSEVDTPDSPKAKTALRQLEGLAQQMHVLHADPGTSEGIGLPGGPRDVTVVGAGPGGLEASIMGGTEGLDTLVIEANATAGGQAKYSSRIENFPGFPIGVTGEHLTQDMMEQAERVGAELKLGDRVTGMTVDPGTGMKHLKLSDGSTIDSRTVILAGGIEFRHMAFPGSDGPGVVIGDGKALTKAADGGDVVVVGGSNGAAQAALGAATRANHVTVLSRSALEKGMSDYQISALRNHPKVTVIEGDTVASMARDAGGNPVSLKTHGGKTIPLKALGVFLGSVPETGWLKGAGVRLDDTGRIATDANFESNVPGVFAVGDMRVGAAGRITAAAGEGQLALREAHRHLEGLRTAGDIKLGETVDAVVWDAPNVHIARLYALDLDNPWFGQTLEPSGEELRDFNPNHDERGRFTTAQGTASAKAAAAKATALTAKRSASAKAAHERRRAHEAQAFPLPEHPTAHQAGMTAVSRVLAQAHTASTPLTTGEVAKAAKADIKRAVEAYEATRDLKEPVLPPGVSRDRLRTAYRMVIAATRYVRDPASAKILVAAVTKNSMTWREAAAAFPPHAMTVAHHAFISKAADTIGDIIIGSVVGAAVASVAGPVVGGAAGVIATAAVKAEVEIGLEKLSERTGFTPEHVKHLLGGVGAALHAHYQKWKEEFGHLTGQVIGRSPFMPDPALLTSSGRRVRRPSRARDAEIDEFDPIEQALLAFDDAVQGWEP